MTIYVLLTDSDDGVEIDLFATEALALETMQEIVLSEAMNWAKDEVVRFIAEYGVFDDPAAMVERALHGDPTEAAWYEEAKEVYRVCSGESSYIRLEAHQVVWPTS